MADPGIYIHSSYACELNDIFFQNHTPLLFSKFVFFSKDVATMSVSC